MDPIEHLRSLDRRLLALESDCTVPEAFRPRLRVGQSSMVPGQVDRVTVELTAIGGEADQVAAALGVSPLDAPVPEFSGLEVRETYAQMMQAVEQLRAHVRRLLDIALARDPSRAAAITETDLDLDLESAEVPGHNLRRLAPFGGMFIMVPLIAGLIYAAFANTRSELQATAVELCAAKPPCAGDEVRIGYAEHSRPTRGQTQADQSLILYRRSADCSREVEVYYHATGDFSFRGSEDDPDLERRTKFLHAREGWRREHEVVATVDCDEAEHLCGGWPFGCR